MTETRTHTLYVTGTHCSACKHLIEATLQKEPDVSSVSVSLTSETITLTTERHVDAESLSARLTGLISTHGYTVHATPPLAQTNWSEWLTALPVVVLLVFGFVLLHRAGITSLIGSSEATLTTALVVGLVASVSTCLAVVGGLVLSVSATYAQSNAGARPQILFHAGRLAGFFVLGGLLGALGEVMQIGVYGSAVLGALASFVMLILGIHLLDITKKVRAWTLPRSISERLTAVAERAGSVAPILLGAFTFFLPCGFTQSMQVMSLSSGSAVTGALTMLVFALGTLPVLALLSFGSLDLAKGRYRGVFFKTAGLVVILFALTNLYGALVVFGIISPILTF